MSPSDSNVLQQHFTEWFYYPLMFLAQFIITLVVQAEWVFNSSIYFTFITWLYLQRIAFGFPSSLSSSLYFWDSLWTNVLQHAPTQNLASALVTGGRGRNADVLPSPWKVPLTKSWSERELQYAADFLTELGRLSEKSGSLLRYQRLLLFLLNFNRFSWLIFFHVLYMP